MKLVVCIVTALFAAVGAAVGAGCGDNQAALQIVTPGSGAIIPTTEPLVLHVSGNGFAAAQTIVTLDDMRVENTTSTLGSDCEPCTFDVTVPISGVTPQGHDVGVQVDVDLNTIAETSVHYFFESPGSGSAN